MQIIDIELDSGINLHSDSRLSFDGSDSLFHK